MADNPFASPDNDDAIEVEGSETFKDLNDKALKKLYYRSCNVSCIGFLLVIGTIAIIAMVTAGGLYEEMDGSTTAIILIIIALYVITIIGVFMRTTWGRVLGIIACVLMLFSLGIPTIIGIFGLVAFIGAPQLFGAKRVTHKDLKAEFKLRKQLLKQAKRATA